MRLLTISASLSLLLSCCEAFQTATRLYSIRVSSHSTRLHSTKEKPQIVPFDIIPLVNEEDSYSQEPLLEGLGRGIRRDFAARLPFLRSDVTDGFKVSCLAATFFMFFACLAPAVGFGGLYAVASNNAIGTVEMITSTAVSGVLFALTAAQPMTIIGGTGPVLAFVACLAQMANTYKLPFLPLYAWTGLWTSAILFVSAMTSASNLVKYLTRFTDEIFSVLISVIFLFEACSNIAGNFATAPLVQALLTLVCASTTYTLSTRLQGLRKTSYFNKPIRNTISNFAPTIGVVVAAWMARAARLSHGVVLPALAIPAQFGTTTGRPWLIPLLDLPVWARWASFLPALMATVLLFLDQNITVRLVNNNKNSMTKGRRPGNVLDGMHADMLVISLLTALQSVFGLPWLVAATVRSLSHVKACAKYDNDGNVVGTIEQRVTGAAIHAGIGCCVLLKQPRQWLALIPKPALMGLFLYLGASSLPGNEFWERFKGLFKDNKAVATKERWTGMVSRSSVRKLTIVQLACLAAMIWVKESPAGVFFPIVIAMLAPLRFALDRSGFIPKRHMEILDEE